MGGAIKWDPLGDFRDAIGITPEPTPTSTGSAVTTSAAAGALGGGGATALKDEESSKRKGVSKKKAGTAGTQVPLQATQSAPTTGIQI